MTIASHQYDSTSSIVHPHNNSVHTFTRCMAPATTEKPTTTHRIFKKFQPYHIDLRKYGSWDYGKTYHCANELILQTWTPQYIYVKIQLPFYILVPITYHIIFEIIYSRNSGKLQPWCLHHNSSLYIYFTIRLRILLFQLRRKIKISIFGSFRIQLGWW